MIKSHATTVHIEQKGIETKSHCPKETPISFCAARKDKQLIISEQGKTLPNLLAPSNKQLKRSANLKLVSSYHRSYRHMPNPVIMPLRI